MKVVLDSSIWISALEFGGVPLAAASKAAREELVVCAYIQSEVAGALKRKFGWTEFEVDDALSSSWASAIWVTTTGAISGVCRDPADDAIIECAVLANAVLIVSGDHDLLELKQYAGVRIMTARQYLEQADAAAV